MRLAVFGAGAWGTALARHAAQRHQVLLWVRDPAFAQALDARHENARYLPGVALDPAIRACSDLADVKRFGAELLVVATSVAGLRPVTGALAAAGVLAQGAAPPLLWLCKGLESDTARLPHEVVAEQLPEAPGGVLSGPSFAQEVAAGLPVALVAASSQPQVIEAAVAAFHHGAARIYGSADLVGVEVAGALKNIMAIATGISDGLGLGMNARAALLTRGLAEMGRYGAALGARTETFMGLAGVGDLVLTCTGDLSRNRRVGLKVATGEPLDAILRGLGHVAEGVACCRAVLDSAQRLGVEMPITQAVGSVLFENRAAREAVAALLAREPKTEFAATPWSD